VIRVLRAADRVATPWKNGGGITREVAIWPPGSKFDDFDWRVSIAEVREAGPFSTFERIDRTMAILNGRLELRLSDRTIALDPSSDPVLFAGDVPCEGIPAGGPVTDLNVMVRRSRATARVARFRSVIEAAAAPRTVLMATARTAIRLGNEEHVLDVLDAALIADTHFGATGEGYAIAFS
jgi:environmental stress-induced protein Ves